MQQSNAALMVVMRLNSCAGRVYLVLALTRVLLQLRHLPDERAGAGEDCLGDPLVGDADLLANCAPTALSKNPPPEEAGLEEVAGLEEEGRGDEALVGLSDFLANWAPTALSKKPPPEEVGLGEVGLEDEACLGAALVGVSDLLAN